MFNKADIIYIICQSNREIAHLMRYVNRSHSILDHTVNKDSLNLRIKNTKKIILYLLNTLSPVNTINEQKNNFYKSYQDKKLFGCQEALTTINELTEYYGLDIKDIIYIMTCKLIGHVIYKDFKKYLPSIHFTYLFNIFKKHNNEDFIKININKPPRMTSKLITDIFFSQDVSNNNTNCFDIQIIYDINENQPIWKKNLLLFATWIIYIKIYKFRTFGILELYYNFLYENQDFALFELCDYFI